MNSSEVPTSLDVILDHTLGDDVFDLFVSVLGEWNITVIFREKGPNSGIVLENRPRGHHEWPLVRFIFGNAPGEVDLGELDGSSAKACRSAESLLPSLFRFDHFFQLWEHVRIPIYINDESERMTMGGSRYIYR